MKTVTIHRPESRHYLQPVIPRPVRTPVVGIRNTLAQSQRSTDCHNQRLRWFRNDIGISKELL